MTLSKKSKKLEGMTLNIEFLFLGKGEYAVTTYCNGVKCEGIIKEVKSNKRGKM